MSIEKDARHHWTSKECKSKALWDFTSHPPGWLKVKKTDSNKGWRGCGGTEPSHTTGGNVKWCVPFGKYFRSPSKCYTSSSHKSGHLPLEVSTQEHCRHLSTEHTRRTQTLKEALFTAARKWKRHLHHWRTDKQVVGCPHNGELVSTNRGRAQREDVDKRKSVANTTEWTIPLTETPRTGGSIDTDWRSPGAGGRGWPCCRGYTVALGGWHQCPEICSYSCATRWIYRGTHWAVHLKERILW